VGARWNICGRRKRRALRPGRYRNILAGDVISDLGECGASAARERSRRVPRNRAKKAILWLTSLVRPI